MSRMDDDGNEMGISELLSDDVIEAFLAGEPHPGWLQDDALVAVDQALAEILARPAPEVGYELASFVNATPGPESVGTPVRSTDAAAAWSPTLRPVASATTPFTSRSTPPRRSSRRLLAVVAGGAAFAATALPVAASTHVLPEPARQAVASVLQAVTPFDFESSPAPTSTRPSRAPSPSTTTAPGMTGSSRPAPGHTPPAPVPSAQPPQVGVPPAGPGAVPATTPPGITPGPPAGITPGPPAATDGPGSVGRGVGSQTSAPATPPWEAGPPVMAGPPAAAGLDRAGEAVGASPATTGGAAPPRGGSAFGR